MCPPSISIQNSGSSAATPSEAAAIAAAVQRFLADTTTVPATESGEVNPWLRAALIEGVSAKDDFGPGEPHGIA